VQEASGLGGFAFDVALEQGALIALVAFARCLVGGAATDEVSNVTSCPTW
jgi:hypothetical protein